MHFQRDIWASLCPGGTPSLPPYDTSEYHHEPDYLLSPPLLPNLTGSPSPLLTCLERPPQPPPPSSFSCLSVEAPVPLEDKPSRCPQGLPFSQRLFQAATEKQVSSIQNYLPLPHLSLLKLNHSVTGRLCNLLLPPTPPPPILSSRFLC